MICDAHHHLWDRPGDGPHSHEARRGTEYVDGLAERYLSRSSRRMNCGAAIISYADLRLGDAVTPILEAHGEASPGRFRGVGHNVGWDASPEIPNSHTQPKQGQLLDPEFRKGLRCLQKQGLLYEAYLG